MEKAVEGKKDRVDKVKDAFSGVETRYSVELPAPEALYVLNYFKTLNKSSETCCDRSWHVSC